MSVKPFSATAPVKALAGSNTEASITFTGDTDTGLYSPGSNQVAVTTGGTQRLLIDGDGNITVANKFSIPLGTQELPSLYFGTDINTGIYSPGADQVAISTNGTGRLFVDASGNVGVGETVPVTRLDVKAGSASAYVAQFTDSVASNHAKIYVDSNGIALVSKNFSNGLAFASNTAQIYAGGSERLRITSAGLVGIGSSTPGQLMVVRGSQPFLEIRDSRNKTWSGEEIFSGILFGTDDNTFTNDPQAFIKAVHTRAGTGHSSADAGLTFGTSASTTTPATERMRIDEQGRVGIGTTSPSVPLHVSSGIAGNEVARFNNAGGFGLRIIPQVDGATTAIRVAGGESLRFDTNNTEAVRIDSSGRLLVGTSSARSNFFNSTNSATFQLEGQFNDAATASIVQCYNANTLGATLVLGKSNTLTVGANALVADGHTLGRVSYQGNDGTEFVEAATILAQVDGTPGANDMPGRLVFSVTADGASSPTERMRLNSSGQLLLGTSTAPNSETFAVDGSAAIENLNGSTVVSVNQNSAATITYTLRSRESGMMFISYSPASTTTPWGSGAGDGLYCSIYFGNLANTRTNVITHDSGRTSTARDGSISVSVSGANIVITKTAGTAANGGDLSIGVVSGHRIKQPVVT